MSEFIVARKLDAYIFAVVYATNHSEALKKARKLSLSECNVRMCKQPYRGDWEVKKVPDNSDIDALRNMVAGAIGTRGATEDDRPISVLNLGGRVYNAITKVGIRSVGDLCGMTELDLLELRSFGKSSLREVKRQLASIGLHLVEPHVDALSPFKRKLLLKLKAEKVETEEEEVQQ